jgi:hypothetical protein
MTCPRCGSSEIRASKTTRWTDVFHLVRGREAVRCRKCGLRFFAAGLAAATMRPAGAARGAYRPTKPMSPQGKKLHLSQLTMVSIFALAAIIFWLFLRYLTAE